MTDWPVLDVTRDHETFAVLHLAAQMLGKIRVAHSPWENHGWQAALQPVARGLATRPTKASHARTFTLTLDLCSHAINLAVSDGASQEIPLNQGCIASLHEGLIEMLEEHRLPSSFNGRPSEIADAVEFASDRKTRAYDPSSAIRLRQAIAAMLPSFARFRSAFCGKSSPVHFWWGAFDLAVSRYSGRTAPVHPGGIPGLADRITREAYSHEVASAGFWAGGVTPAEPFFYSYIYPEPQGYSSSRVGSGRYNDTYHEFVLPYSEVIGDSDPEAKLSRFFADAYEAAADLARWDRSSLEREPIAP